MSVAARFAEYVEPEPNTGCFLWLGAMSAKGYGRFTVAGKVEFAHRIAYELAHGPLAPDTCVLHSCDNPSCVNPAHLHAGDRLLNAREREQRNRGAKATRLTCKRGHPFNAENTYEWAGRPGVRLCRKCRARWSSAR